jgi:tetratricopeptide (TPR) repeat protein
MSRKSWSEQRGRNGSLILGLAATAGLLNGSLRGESETAINVGQSCHELREAATKTASRGTLNDVVNLLSPALSPEASQPDRTCAGVVLGQLASSMSVSARHSVAAIYAERSVRVLESAQGLDSPMLLHPLHTLAAALINLGKLTRARSVVRRMETIPSDRPEHTAMLHGITARLLQWEDNPRQAEAEYQGALSALKRAGRDRGMDAAVILSHLSGLYLRSNRLDDAETVAEQAASIAATAPDAMPIDKAYHLNLKGVIHVHRREFSAAEHELRQAIAVAEHETGSDPVVFCSILRNYAEVLRKLGRRREARAVEKRAEKLTEASSTQHVIDITALRRQ